LVVQGNLLNVHSEKYSGLSNARTLHVADTGSGVVILSRKPKASPHAVKGAYARTAVRARSGGRRHAGVVSGFAKRGYRADLRKVRCSFPLPLPFCFGETRGTPQATRTHWTNREGWA
jgi:hypothetical protein